MHLRLFARPAEHPLGVAVDREAPAAATSVAQAQALHAAPGPARPPAPAPPSRGTKVISSCSMAWLLCSKTV